MVFWLSCSSTDSVISSSSRSGGRPDAASACSTTSIRSRLICSGERLIATLTGADQRAACVQARRSAHSPSSEISPISSARAMNSAGGTSPRLGCVQRIRASKPVTLCVSRQMIG